MINVDTVVVKHNGTARFPETYVQCLRCPCLNCSPYQVQPQAQVRLCSLSVSKTTSQSILNILYSIVTPSFNGSLATVF